MKIKGIPVGTTTPRPNWDQHDPRKADFIRNKPPFEDKQNQLSWITDEDVDAMFEGTYEGVEDEAPGVLLTYAKVTQTTGYSESLVMSQKAVTVALDNLGGGSGSGTGGGTGADGKSAYEIALEHGFEGTEEEWLASLKGEPGHTPEKGVDYFTEADNEEMVDAVLAALPSAEGVGF